MPDADSAERGSAVTAAEAAGETAPRRDREGRNRRFCSTWTLNAVAAAMHAAWFVIFVLLWALDENEDGSKRDVTYPLFYTSARFGKPPDPPTTPAESLVLDASVSTEPGSTTPINPFPSCDAPRDARVGTMPVSPAFRDSHLVMSLHWLVSSFFALSFLFQAAAAVADARRVGFVQTLDSEKKNDDDVSASLVAGGALRGNDHVTTPHRAALASWLRFVEYSFSAAVMVVAIALQVGLMDAWMLFALAALTWTTMMLGLLGERVLAAEERVVAAGARAERSSRLNRGDDESETNDTPPSSVSSQARDDPRRAMRSETAAVAAALRVVRWTAHLTGWVSQGVVFVVIVAHFFASQRACEWEDSTEEGNRREDNVAPDFVYAIVFAELALFVGFGATQFAQFAQFDRDVYAERRRGIRGTRETRGICGTCGTCGAKRRAKRRERRRGSEKKETTTKSENEDETDGARCVCGTAAAPAGYDRAARARALARAEAAYIVQSFVSKTLLGWLTYGGNFA
jgi:hypothetical protein